LGATPSGPTTSNRLNTDIFPPSRLLPQTQGSTQGTTGTGAGVTGSSGNPSDQTQQNQTGPLGTNAQTNQNSLGLGTNGADQNGQNNSMGFNSQGGASNQLKQIDPNQQTSGGSSTGRTGRNELTVTINDCIKLWDDKTHMSKSEWRATCKRVQNHLNGVIVK